MRLSDQTRINITSSAEEHIADLVANHNGDADDVRRIIANLIDQARFGAHDGASGRGNRSTSGKVPNPFQWQEDVSSP